MRLLRALTITITTLITLSFIAGPAGPAPAVAQQALDRSLRVFLDCNEFHCDDAFLTQEVSWVRFVRDRESADVHVLGTRESTGAGGSLYTMEFRGRGPLDGERLTLLGRTLPDATDSDQRAELLRVIRLGLAPLAARTSAAPKVEVVARELNGDEEAAVAAVDPWNYWVFRVGVDGDAEGESQQSDLGFRGDASASRVTDDWKIMTSVRGNVNRSEYPDEDEEGAIYVSTRESYGVEASAVRSLGPHWGVGGLSEWQRSTYNNYDHSAVLGPAIEYNVFPYSESTRRLLTFFYAIGPRYNVYQDSTIFGELEELLIQQLFVATYEVIQPWGEVELSTDFDHYIAKFSEGLDWDEPQYNLSLSGGFDVRVFQGFSVRTRGRATLVRGQIQLPAEGLTGEEILTQQRELATDYRYSIFVGLSYRFGSIFSSVVNPRFRSL